MSDPGYLKTGIERAKMFRSSPEVWNAIDYSATHMYDYQNYFTEPDKFDARLKEWKKQIGDKPFLSTEICINYKNWQWRSYRVALAIGQLYQKNLVLTDASAICYCWTIINVVQPSYGWSRSLFVPDKAAGFVPVPSSYQLRVLGAYSRRVQEDMVRVEATANNQDLLVCAFAGADQKGSVVVLNRSTRPKMVSVNWPGMTFSEMEIVNPYYQNQVKTIQAAGEGAPQVLIEPGAIITLTNVPLRIIPAGFNLD
jgi:hypothetical protein